MAGDLDGNPSEVTELDALIAYLQILGRMVDFTTYRPELANQRRPVMWWQDIAGLARSAWTVWMVLIFLGIGFYALRPRNKRHFDDCAQIPFRAESKERQEP